MSVFEGLVHLDSFAFLEQNSSMPENFEQLHRESRPVKKSKISPRKLFSKLLFLGVVIAMAVFASLYFNAQKQLSILSSTQGQTALAQKEIKEVTEQLGKLTILPSEEAVVATILDAKALATQSAFYANAQNGDKLVVFSQAQKAYIYSPSKNIVVNAGPLVVDQNSNSVPVKFELRNGTPTRTALEAVKAKLDAQQQLITAVGDAATTDYTTTQVVILNPVIKTEDLTKFAQDLDSNAKLTRSLPKAEKSSEADILIIVGAKTVSPEVSPAP